MSIWNIDRAVLGGHQRSLIIAMALSGTITLAQARHGISLETHPVYMDLINHYNGSNPRTGPLSVYLTPGAGYNQRQTPRKHP